MRVKVIFLDYLRKDHSQKVKDINLNNAGHPFDLVEIEQFGISAAINKGLQLSKGYDAAFIMPNDITLPDNWLAECVKAATAIPNTGAIGIYCVEHLPEAEVINGIKVHPTPTPFGANFIPMKAVSEIGYWNTDFDPYGMQDADYYYRLNLAGYQNYYLHGLRAWHIGHDVGNGTEYRKMKDDGLIEAMPKWTKWTTHYNETGDYTIFYPEYDNR